MRCVDKLILFDFQSMKCLTPIVNDREMRSAKFSSPGAHSCVQGQIQFNKKFLKLKDIRTTLHNLRMIRANSKSHRDFCISIHFTLKHPIYMIFHGALLLKINFFIAK